MLIAEVGEGTPIANDVSVGIYQLSIYLMLTLYQGPI